MLPMHIRPLALLALVFVFGFAACRSKPAEAPSQPSSPVEAASPWHIELKLTPEKPRMVSPVTFTVHIADGNGRPVDNAKVTGALSMKLMDMGNTVVSFESKGNGRYEGTLKSLDMSGPWELAVDASQGGFHAQKKFEVIIYD